MENAPASDIDDTKYISNCDGNVEQCLNVKPSPKKNETKYGKYNILFCCCFWVSVLRCFEVVSLADLFTSVMYVADVISDLCSALSLLQGKPINTTMFSNDSSVSYNASYNKEVCDNLDDYSHTLGGISGLTLLWLPAFPLLVQAFVKGLETLYLMFTGTCDVKLLENILKFFILCLTVMTWPITGVIM